MSTPSAIKSSSAIQPSKFEFQPNFSAALEREKNTPSASTSKVTKTELNIEDSFGSWREWD
ncbi:hypothetical protein [Pelagibaculum spongiae]|uniref:Uncharacterized protein n=1 Tax=Pelagibaculum spongiae TaxID=2080658 RepID=A0A2V1GPJ7_9GAMM|nr:hypothetical protein [Pelagibaculum spongiae]PVZ64509.1 hypothetical protein DC094_19545 [Pelagibaculum spongiae]